MVKLNVKIVSMQDADKFNKICSKFDCDMDLQSGKYYVLNADTDDEQKVREAFAEFVQEA